MTKGYPDNEKEIDSLHKQLKGHYDNFEHKGAIKNYTEKSFYLNDHLHQIHQEPGQKISTEFESQVKHLDAATVSQKAPKTFHVYTGIMGNPKKVLHPSEKTPEGHHKVVLPAFTSTSIDPHTASTFAEKNVNTKTKGVDMHLLKIEIPKDSNHGTYVEKETYNKGEGEFLLKRGLKLHIHPKPEIQHKTGVNKSKQTHYIWHAKIV